LDLLKTLNDLSDLSKDGLGLKPASNRYICVFFI